MHSAMKIFARFLALLLALTLALPAFALAQDTAVEETEENPVLVTIDDQEIRLDEVQLMLDRLVANDYITDPKDYKTALDYLVQTRLLALKMVELNLEDFTAEEEEALKAEVHTEWENAIAQYVSYYTLSDSDPEQLRQAAIDYYTSNGVTEETLLESLKGNVTQDRLEAYLIQDKDVTVTPEEIRAVFEEYATQDMEGFGGNIAMYELYENYYGTQFWFIPEGYRGILRITLKAGEDLLSAYSQAQSAYEESKTEENPQGDEALKAALDEAYQAVIDSRKDKLEEISGKLDNGESFVILISLYDEDEVAQDEATLAEGLSVHRDSIVWEPAFTTGAFSEKMQQPGDVSDPVIGQAGIMLLYYLRDVPAGFAPLTDDISAEIEDYLHNMKVNDILTEALYQWQTEHNIVYNQEAIYALTVENAAEAPAAE